MNNGRQLRLELLDSILWDDPSVSREVVSKKPYTFVKLLVCDDWQSDEPVVGYGFSKVCYPDKWDYQVGVNLATAKAVQHVVEQMNIIN